MKKKIALFVAAIVMAAGIAGGAAYAKAAAGNKMKSGAKPEAKCEQSGGMGMMGMMGMMGGMGMPDGMHMGMMLKNPKMQRELGLDADQKAKLKAIFTAEARKSVKAEADLKILHLDLKDLGEAYMRDSAKIDAKIDEIAAACAGMMKNKMHAMEDAINVLTPEQREKCMAMMEKMDMGGKEMKGMGM